MIKSRSFQRIPVINISGLYSEQLADRQKVADEIADAAKNVGFFYITGHDIPRASIDGLLSSTKKFFDQPIKQKMNYYIGNSINHSGYVPEGEEQFYGAKIDKKEAYDINNDVVDGSISRPMLGPNQWPTNQDDFKRNVSQYYHNVLNLGDRLFKGFALSLGLPEDTFDEKLNTPPSQLRLIHYPFSPEATDQEGIGAHTDYECFTLLLPTTDGLEVLNGDGVWIDAPVIEGAFVVNIGDMLEIISNGRFVATSHRVRKVKEERYSFPLFCACDYDTVIEPMVPADPDSSKSYEPLSCGDHLYAQTIQTFSYLKQRLERGEIELPETSKDTSSFGNLRAALEGENA
jgi:isopenicillin N synthase-like dioxygenase